MPLPAQACVTDEVAVLARCMAKRPAVESDASQIGYQSVTAAQEMVPSEAYGKGLVPRCLEVGLGLELGPQCLPRHSQIRECPVAAIADPTISQGCSCPSRVGTVFQAIQCVGHIDTRQRDLLATSATFRTTLQQPSHGLVQEMHEAALLAQVLAHLETEREISITVCKARGEGAKNIS
jgi:hypothetical protein